jgi:hypothetical protein
MPFYEITTDQIRKRVQNVQVAFVEFRGPIVLSAIEQAPLPVVAEAGGDSIGGGVVHSEDIGGVISAATFEQVDDHQIA